MFAGCNGLHHFSVGTEFQFIGTDYGLDGSWKNAAGTIFAIGDFPNNTPETYVRVG